MVQHTDPNANSSSRSLSYLTWLRLMRVMQKFRRLAESEVQDSGYSAAQFAVLFQVLGTEGITQQELAEQLEVTKGNVAQLVDKLENAGFLNRQREGHAKRVFLTSDGRDFAQRYFHEQEQFIDAKMSMLSVEEQAQLLTLLRKLDRHLK